MNSFRLVKLLTLIIFFSFFILPTATLAQTGNPPAPPIKIEIPNPLKNGTNSLPDLLNLIINSVILPIGGVVVVVMIIYAGFLYVTAQGNETKIKTAHTAFLYAIVGAAILLGARVLSEAIKSTITQLGG